MQADAHRDLLERATAAIEGIDATMERHDREMMQLVRRIDQRDALAAQRHQALMQEHRRLLDRFARSEDRVVDALGDLGTQVEPNGSRVDDMGDAIRAGTQAILSMLDRLGPAPG